MDFDNRKLANISGKDASRVSENVATYCPFSDITNTNTLSVTNFLLKSMIV